MKSLPGSWDLRLETEETWLVNGRVYTSTPLVCRNTLHWSEIDGFVAQPLRFLHCNRSGFGPVVVLGPLWWGYADLEQCFLVDWRACRSPPRVLPCRRGVSGPVIVGACEDQAWPCIDGSFASGLGSPSQTQACHGGSMQVSGDSSGCELSDEVSGEVSGEVNDEVNVNGAASEVQWPSSMLKVCRNLQLY